MTKRLGESDRHAVDLLLDRSMGATNGSGDGTGSGGYVTHAQPGTEPGLQSVQRVLSLLEMMPTDEPPADLMARALARIDARGAMAMGQSAALLSDRPHA